ncbi:hypothetical protein MMPV_006294 [Pyropia vietnamensis]
MAPMPTPTPWAVRRHTATPVVPMGVAASAPLRRRRLLRAAVAAAAALVGGGVLVGQSSPLIAPGGGGAPAPAVVASRAPGGGDAGSSGSGGAAAAADAIAVGGPWPPPRHPSSPRVDGVSVVAACAGRQAVLPNTLQSWLALRGVVEVVLVDWSSSPPLEAVARQVVASTSPDGRTGGGAEKEEGGGERGSPATVPLRVVRVEGEEEHAVPATDSDEGTRDDNGGGWVLTRAYNLGFAAAVGSSIFKVDCDYVVSPAAVLDHPIDANGSVFYTGDWAGAADDNAKHANGALLATAVAIGAVGGYDERIQSYGYDDTDLYGRLVAAGGERRPLSASAVTHVPHGDGLRGGRLVRAEIEANSLLVGLLPPWAQGGARPGEGRAAGEDGSDLVVGAIAPTAAVMPSTYERVAGGSQREAERGGLLTVDTVRATRRPPSVRACLATSPAAVDAVWAMAVGRKLREEFLIPWGIITSLNTPTRTAFYTRLLGDDDGGSSAGDDGVTRVSPRWARRAFFLHAQHGLGNRLRALSAAGAYANATGRVLVVVWEPDAHVGARFGSLFSTAGAPFVVTDTWAPRYPFPNASVYDAAWESVDAYSYMPVDVAAGGVKQARIIDTPGRHIYLKSAYTLETSAPLHTVARETAYLRMLSPAPAVTALTTRCASRGVAERVGVHIRCLSVSAEGLPIDADAEYTAAGVAATDAHRSASAVSAFITEARRLVSTDSSTRFFVAADDPAAASTFRSALGGGDSDGVGDGTTSVVDGLWKDSSGDAAVAAEGAFPGKDRSEAAMVRAAADLYCLSATRSLLGSEWSAFTKTAARLGGLRVRYAGADFGVDANSSAMGEGEGGGEDTPPPRSPTMPAPGGEGDGSGEGGGGGERHRTTTRSLGVPAAASTTVVVAR